MVLFSPLFPRGLVFAMRGGFGETLGRPGRCAFLSLGRGGRPAFLGGADFQGGISRCVRWRLPGGPARPTWHFPCAGPGICGLGATPTSALGGLVDRVWSWGSRVLYRWGARVGS